MITLTTRSYQGKRDAAQIADLLNLCDANDPFGRYHSAAELLLEFSEPGFDASRNVQLWLDRGQRLIGYGYLWISPTGDTTDGYLGFQVHPDMGQHGIAQDILSWGEMRLRQVGQEHGQAACLRANRRDYQPERQAILERAGFRTERCFISMGRSLHQPIPQPTLPPGFRIRPVNGTADAAAWVEAFNQSFIDHWNHHPLTLEQHLHWLEGDPKYQPELDLVAIDPDQRMAGFCASYVDPESNQQRQQQEGWISLLGTCRGFRRLGLGRALLLSGLQALQAAGLEQARLGVDDHNPNQAQTLYTSVGFQQLYTNLTCVKDLN